jgi:hypothetical protein
MCVTYKELTTDEGGEPVIKQGTLNWRLYKNPELHARRGGGEGSSALIIYNSLPEKYQKRWVEKYKASPEELYKKAMVNKTVIKTDDKAREFYDAFRYDLNGAQTSLNEDLKDKCVLNASALNALIRDLNDKVALSKALNNSRRDLWNIIAGSCENMRKVHKHTLPNNPARLRDKIREYRRPMTYNGETYPHNYRCLISGKIGNVNTMKITPEVGELLVALKCSRNPVFTDRQIFERFNEVELPKHNAGLTNPKEHWKPLKSEKSMREWLNQPEIIRLWYGSVFGELKARQKFNIKLTTEPTSCRDARWEGDGTKLNLYYRGEDGKRHTCTVYEVIDTYSEALLGYWISDTEDAIQQYHAFRMAVQNTRRKPYEIVTDNQGGAKTKRMQDFMKAISHIARPTMPNNPQSKTIESVLGRFQQQVLHQHWAFTGQNVTTKKESSKPNLEFVQENADKLPTKTELFELYAQMREMWNGQRAMPTTETILKHPKEGIGRMEMYLTSQNELAPEMSAREMAESFWLWTDKPSEYKTDGIKIQVDKKEYKYVVFAADEVNTPDAAWLRNNLYRKFWTKFDPYDMSQVKLYWEDKAGDIRFERLASPPVTVHRAIQDQQEGEMAIIRRIRDLNRQEQVERYLAAQEIMWKHEIAPDQNGLYTPKLAGFTNEEMAEVNMQLERKTRKYREKSIAQEYKDISMMSYDEVQDFDEQEARVIFNLKRVAGKL